MTLLLLFLVPMLIGLWAQHSVKSTFQRFAEQPNAFGQTGAQVARAILDANGLHDVPVAETPGALTDHYDPATRSVHLSQTVYGERTVSAAAVAAHEVGHAIQHAKAYLPMQARSAVFPAVAFSSGAAMPLVMVGLVLLVMGALVGKIVLLVGLVLYSLIVLFHIVTLPVEFDASRRAKRQLRELNLVSASDGDGTAKVLGAAAMTYVAAALAATATLMYYALMVFGDE